MLKPGDILNFDMSGGNGRVLKQIGEGGQGVLYTVAIDKGSKVQVVKWYKNEFVTQEQRGNIEKLIEKGPPSPVRERFIWPLDVVSTPDNEGFGYLMEWIDKSKYAELPEIWAGSKPPPTVHAKCEASRQAAESYKALHATGCCYRDISMGNIMLDPVTGNVVICDNDNVRVNDKAYTKIRGTMEFMAPEIILGKAHPSTESDLHSLAVFFFYLWVCHNPFHGEKEYSIRCWDIPAKKKIYGEEPVFIFDPIDRSNALPSDPEYKSVSDQWENCPIALQAHFSRAFSEGLLRPEKRVTEGEWVRLFRQLKQSIVSCPKCQAENLVDHCVINHGVSCWHCKHSISRIQAFEIINPTSHEWMVASPGVNLFNEHFGKENGNNGKILMAEVVAHPQDKALIGLRNMDNKAWDVLLPNGNRVALDQGKAIPLQDGLKIRIGESELTVQG